jgi:hypothetical protein
VSIVQDRVGRPGSRSKYTGSFQTGLMVEKVIGGLA